MVLVWETRAEVDWYGFHLLQDFATSLQHSGLLLLAVVCFLATAAVVRIAY